MRALRSAAGISGVFSILLILSMLNACSSLQVGPEEATFATPRSSIPEPPQPAPTPPLILGPQDVLRVEVWRQDDVSRQVTVDRQGDINLPLVGRISVAGQNLDWLLLSLGENFSKYYTEPQVMVELLESPLQKAFILGEVKKPGSYGITGSSTVLQLLAEAGDVTGDADLTAVVLIRGDIQNPMIIPVDLKAALNGDLSQDWYLLRGDIVYVNRSKIASIEAFARRITAIIDPIHAVERAFILGAMVPDAALHGQVNTRVTID